MRKLTIVLYYRDVKTIENDSERLINKDETIFTCSKIKAK